VAIALSLVGIAPSNSLAAPLAIESRPTPVTALGHLAAWSSFDEARDGYVLKLYDGHRIRVLEIAPRPIPFDADLGRAGPAGGVQLLYSRCTREARVSLMALPLFTRGSGCTLHEYDIQTMRSRRLRPGGSRRSGVLPTRWGNRLAFASAGDGADRRSRIWLARRDTVRAVRGGSPGVAGTQVLSLDLRGEMLAYAWRLRPERCERATPEGQADPAAIELRLLRLGRRGRRLTRWCSFDPGVIGLSPGIRSDSLLAIRRLVPPFPYATDPRVELRSYRFKSEFSKGPAVAADACLVSAAPWGRSAVISAEAVDCDGGLDNRPVRIEIRSGP
jgi:hypothetical protein